MDLNSTGNSQVLRQDSVTPHDVYRGKFAGSTASSRIGSSSIITPLEKSSFITLGLLNHIGLIVASNGNGILH